MKAGQLLSMELRDVLPPEVIEVLSQLQSSGATVDFGEIRAVLERELGEKLIQLEVSEAPLASASIGQVHRARWRRPDGVVEELVLKVQFAGIADTIDSDLKLLERIARLFLSVQLKAMDLTAVFVELRDVLQRETDYLHEADALEQYRALAHQVPGLKVPRVERSLSTGRVLALSYEEGLSLDALMAKSPDAALRHRTAHQLLDLFFREFFQWGLVQTDANFANFLFRPERGELVLLDFGATRSYPAPFRTHYRALLLSSLSGDRAGLLAAAQALGLIDAREGEPAQQALVVLLQTVLKVFTDAVQPIDFTDGRFVDDAARRLKEYYQALQFSAPPAQLIFLHRKLGGIYTLGKALRATLDLAPYRERLATDCWGTEASLPSVA
jgi:predicted unusual protein kinase regulating ubiquinone biosynthesis (AarF/ABC1/UbiB family)